MRQRGMSLVLLVLGDVMTTLLEGGTSELAMFQV
jgi:mannose/fructose/N-acetylgalactosamine-specific phosphotransferase system component IIC